MYDAREKAIRDRKWELNGAFREGQREGQGVEGEIKGKAEGEIKLIRTLQGILGNPRQRGAGPAGDDLGAA